MEGTTDLKIVVFQFVGKMCEASPPLAPQALYALTAG